MLEMSVV